MMRSMGQRVVALAMLIALGVCPPFAVAQEQKKSLFQKAAEALRGAVGPQRAVAPPRRAVNPPNPANARIKGERRERVDAHVAAMLSWVESACDLTDEQKVKVTDMLKAQVDTEQDQWEKAPNRGEQNGNRDFIPFEFLSVMRKLTHSSKTRRMLDEILTEEQVTRLKAARDARDTWLRENLVGLALLVLDRELYLSPELREPVSTRLRTMFGSKIYNGLYSFNNNGWPFQRAQFTKNSKLKAVLGDVRSKRYERLTKNNGQSEQYIMISMDGSDDSGAESLKKAIEAQPERIQEAMAVRIQFLKETEQLSAKDARRLTLAAKGAGSREIDKWIDESKKQLKQMREQFVNQNVSWGMNVLRVDRVERNKLWTKTRDRVLSKGEGGSHSDDKRVAEESEEDRQEKAKQQMRTLVKSAIAELLNRREPEKEETVARTERQQYHRSAMVNYAVAILSQELWLRPEQREPVRKLVEESLANYSRYFPTSNYVYYAELQMLADALHVPKEAKWKALLSPTQTEALQQLKKQLVLDKATNLLRLTYRHGDMQFQFIAGRKSR